MALEKLVDFSKYFVTFSDLSLALMVGILALFMMLFGSRHRPTAESFSNLATFLLRSYCKLFILLLFGKFYTYTYFSQWGLIKSSPGWISFIACFVLVDFLKYWQHWCGHHLTIFRLGHTVHHSGSNFDITTSIRVPMMLYELLFLLPCFLLGFPLEYILISIVLQFLYSLLVHINFDHSWLRKSEWLLITPRLHKIHHNKSGTYNKNFGFIFSIWDRLFKSYDDSLNIDDVVIGLENFERELNPALIQLRPYLKYWKKKTRS